MFYCRRKNTKRSHKKSTVVKTETLQNTAHQWKPKNPQKSMFTKKLHLVYYFGVKIIV